MPGHILSAMKENAKSSLGVIVDTKIDGAGNSNEEEEYGVQWHLDLWVNCTQTDRVK